MARAPFQVLIYPYRTTHESCFEYAVFKRADEGFSQGISGGGEDGESPCHLPRFAPHAVGWPASRMQRNTIEIALV